MSKLRFFFILLLLLGIAASSFAQEEIQVGDSVDGEDDEDPVEYELFLEEGQSVEIALSSDDFDTYLYILDEDGDEINHNDDYDGTDSYLVYTAEDSETITIQVASCCSGEGPTGDYELSVDEIEVVAEIEGGTLAYGDSIEIEPSGTSLITFTFEGTEGDVITLTAVSEGSDDTSMTLLDPDGDEAAHNDDDGGLNRNPAIRRFQLPATGQYTVEVEGFNDSVLFSNIEVSLEETDLLLVNDGPQTLEFDPDHIADIMTFDVEEDASYLVTVTLSETSESALFINVLEEEQSYALTRISIANTATIAFVFTAEETGRAHLQLEFYTYDDDIEVTIQAEPLDQ
jgi:hypothetical protein